MRIAELIERGIAVLTEAKVPDCSSDVSLLLGHCLNKSRTQLLVACGEEAPAEAVECFFRLLARRARREPVAYILGEQEFWSRSFLVNSAVLIPRPETEFMLEMVLKRLQGRPLVAGGVLDLCCGSGVIGIILALELRRKVTAVDISAAALTVSRQNCRRHRVQPLVNLVRSDLLEGISADAGLSLIVTNPPYVSRYALQCEVEPEVGRYEPDQALDGGERGLDVICRIRDDLPRVLARGGQVFMEIGSDQGAEVEALFRRRALDLPNFEYVEIIKDYAGHDRVLHGVLEA